MGILEDYLNAWLNIDLVSTPLRLFLTNLKILNLIDDFKLR